MNLLMPRFHHTYHCRLCQGLVVEVRPIMPSDAPYLMELFHHLSADTLYRRFNQHVDHIPVERVQQESEQIVHSAVFQGRGWLAFADLPNEGRTPIGGMRWAQINRQTAEIAMTIRDDFQGQGLGKQLFRILVQEGRRAGLDWFVGYVHAGNEPVWRMLQAMGLPYTRRNEGSAATVVIAVRPGVRPEELETELMAQAT